MNMNVIAVYLFVGATVSVLAGDPIDVLTTKLNSDPMWPNGEAPRISLPSNAAPKEVVASAAKMWGFDSGHIKTYQVLGVRKMRLDGMPDCSAALIESDLGRKILLFRYEQHGKRSFWWTRFFAVPLEAGTVNGSERPRLSAHDALRRAENVRNRQAH